MPRDLQPGAAKAITEVHKLLYKGYTDVVDADLTKCFDTIPHRNGSRDKHKPCAGKSESESIVVRSMRARLPGACHAP